VGDPPPQRALHIGLTAALLGETHRPGAHLLDWLSKLPDQPLRWDAPARAKLLEVLQSGRARTWRFLALTGLLDRGLPEIGEALARRNADPYELDPSGALRWPLVGRLIESDELAKLSRPDLVVLAGLVLDAADDTDRSAPPVIAARRIAQRLDLGARGEETVAGLVADIALLTSASRRLDAFAEERILALASHLETPSRPGAVPPHPGPQPLRLRRTATARGAAPPDPAGDGPPRTHGPGGLEPRHPAAGRGRPAGGRPGGAGPARRRPRAYVLATTPEALARQAALCEPPPVLGTVRVVVTGAASRRWVVDVVARHGPDGLVRQAMVLADAGLDVREAVLATGTTAPPSRPSWSRRTASRTAGRLRRA